MSVPPSRVRPACACARARARAAAAAAARGSARLLFPEFLQRRLQHALDLLCQQLDLRRLVVHLVWVDDEHCFPVDLLDLVGHDELVEAFLAPLLLRRIPQDSVEAREHGAEVLAVVLRPGPRVDFGLDLILGGELEVLVARPLLLRQAHLLGSGGSLVLDVLLELRLQHRPVCALPLEVSLTAGPWFLLHDRLPVSVVLLCVPCIDRRRVSSRWLRPVLRRKRVRGPEEIVERVVSSIPPRTRAKVQQIPRVLGAGSCLHRRRRPDLREEIVSLGSFERALARKRTLAGHLVGRLVAEEVVEDVAA
mmetsp:Transcript_13199/g.20766  ORF Transcript_13199/g.20766 Transcript_13199/m.20766 type:complete len:307 (-) Transcript_13199:76-996(-)